MVARHVLRLFYTIRAIVLPNSIPRGGINERRSNHARYFRSFNVWLDEPPFKNNFTQLRINLYGSR